MSISYTYNKDAQYIHTKVTETITLPEVLDYVDTILENNDIASPFYEIVDFENIESFDFGYYQADTLYNKLVLLKKINSIWALVLLHTMQSLLAWPTCLVLLEKTKT